MAIHVLLHQWLAAAAVDAVRRGRLLEKDKPEMIEKDSSNMEAEEHVRAVRICPTALASQIMTWGTS